jgi:ornithine cyclodeaminase/alanine dehydrogenase-like protein (mu-crystallin family)
MSRIYNFFMRTIREEDVRRLLPMSDAIERVQAAFEGLAVSSAMNQVRRRLLVPGGAVLHQLAGCWGGYFGTKIYSTHPRYGAHFHLLLYEAETAHPLAFFEANYLGQIRTGAATGVATRLLARPEATVVAVIGSGFQAETQLEAIRAVRPIQEARVWSRSAEKRKAFADRFNAVATESAAAAVRGADILVTATWSKDPVVVSAWVEDGCHVNAVGSNNPQRREIPPELLERCSLVAVDSMEQARIESGDLLLAFQPDDWTSARVMEFQEVAVGRRGRQSPQEITLFKSNGLGVQDVAAAALVYERFIQERPSEDPNRAMR